MSLLIDLMHLVVIASGLGIGAWALITLRQRLPRGRFIVFGAASVGAIFGCAALASEVGLISPVAWFVVVMSAMLAPAVIALRSGQPNHTAA